MKKAKAKVVAKPKPVQVKVSVKAPIRAVAKRAPGQTTPTPREVKKAMQEGTQEALRATEKQKRLQKLILENVGREKPHTMEEMMILAGYSPNTAHAQPPSIVDAARNAPEVQEFVRKLKAHRDKMLARMDQTIDKASYGNVAFAMPGVNKAIELLEGRPTDRVESVLSDEDKAELDAILRDNR